MSSTECPTCGRNDFASERGVKLHHARSHDEPLRDELECETCDSTFKVYPSHSDRRRFCSQECENEWKSMEYRTEPETYTCEQCGDTFERRGSRVEPKRFCSRDCLYKWRSERPAKDDPRYSRFELECEVCDETFEVWPSDSDARRTCSMKCTAELRSEEYSGEGNPKWRGGKSVYDAVKRQLSNWQRARRQHRGEKCEMCGATDELHLHHVVPILSGGTNEPWNLMTLCAQCHPKAESVSRELVPSVLTEP